MGVSHSTARVLAPASFAFDFAAQLYGMLSSPNMKDVHDANLAAFSPQPFFIAGFFGPQQLIQLAWLYKLWTSPPPSSSSTTSKEDDADTREMIRYVPVYVLGNICIGTWMFFWNANDLKTSNIFVIANTLAQLAFVSSRALRPLNTASTPSILTHVVAKTFAGIGVLDLLHNTSAAYFRGVEPAGWVQGLTGAGFAVGAAASDWILGGSLAYDLVALSVGQMGIGNEAWGRLLGGFAIGAAGITALRNWFL